MFIFLIFLIFLGITIRNCYEEKFTTSDDISVGFIILRHVNNELTDKYWKRCYQCIRKYYPENKIMIIDDNSDYKYITNTEKLYNTMIIDSTYKKRGEILPYYYFLLLKPFEKAVIIHDSVFINSYIDFSEIKEYKLIWDFTHHADNPKEEIELLSVYNDDELIDFYNKKSSWLGCFGAMTIITHECIEGLNKKYNFEKLLPLIDTRERRMCFERIISCLLMKEYGKKDSLFGDIHKYCKWGTPYEQIDTLIHLPFIKIWTGR